MDEFIEGPEHISASARLIRPLQMAARLGVGRKTLERMEDRGEIGPPRITLSQRVVCWDAVEVEAWLTERTPAGGLWGAKDWPAVWARIKRRPAKAVRSTPAAPPKPDKPGKPGKKRRKR